MRHKNTPTERILNSLVFIEKDKKTLTADFKDKNIKLEITPDYAIVSTTFHKYIINAFTNNEYNEAYLFMKEFTEIALEHNLRRKTKKSEDYLSYTELAEYMSKDCADRHEMIIFQFCDMWLYNINQPIKTLRNDSISSFVMYINYISNLANNSILLKEHKDDITNKKYIDLYINAIKEMTKENKERVILKGCSDEELETKIIEEDIKNK